MMNLPFIEVEGYKAFRDRTRIELRPLTLLYGRNQAGKSSLLRLFPGIADSVFGDVPVLDTSSIAFGTESLKELGWLGPNPSFSPILRIGNASSSKFIEIQYTDDDGIVPNRILLGHSRGNNIDVSGAGDVRRTSKTFQGLYAGTVSGTDWQGNVSFSGLLPGHLPSKFDNDLASVVDSLKVIERVQWLSATTLVGDEQNRPCRVFRSDSADLPNRIEHRPDILDAASDWLARPEILGETVRVGRSSLGKARLEISGPGSEALPMHLTGEGIRWLLPVLITLCWSELKDETAPTMLAIEEPEARLHPNLQVHLIDKIVEASTRGVPCIIETHSIYILRALQLACVEERINSADVGIYWVQRENGASVARSVKLVQDGTLTGWLPETFEEEQALSRRIFEARWKKKR